MVELLPGVAFRLFSAVPQLQVRPKGLGRFFLSGIVPSFADPALELHSPAGSVDVPLAQHSRAADAVRALTRRLPRGVRAQSRELEQGVELTLQETVVPAAAVPRVTVMSTDTQQRVRVLDDNRFELIGAVGDDCLITLGVERRRATIAVARGTSAADTAALLAARAPHGYVATAEGSIVTVWKDADLSTLAA